LQNDAKWKKKKGCWLAPAFLILDASLFFGFTANNTTQHNNGGELRDMWPLLPRSLRDDGIVAKQGAMATTP
jgi:hypothetical protein